MTQYNLNMLDLDTKFQDGPFGTLGIEVFFAVELFSASKRRRLAQGSARLAQDAAIGLIEAYPEWFGRIQQRKGYPYAPGHHPRFVSDLAELLSNDRRVKSYAFRLLRDMRQTIFQNDTLTLGQWHIAAFGQDEHPSDTFNRTLDYIEHVASTDEYKKLFPLKRNVTMVARVSDALKLREC